jgi:hypothetical protein
MPTRLERGRKKYDSQGASDSCFLHARNVDPAKFSSNLGSVAFAGDTPLPPRSNGIFELAENLQVIYGAQRLAGKILSREYLAGLAYSLSLAGSMEWSESRVKVE